MSPDTAQHPSDEVLVRAIDGELSRPRRRALDRHLQLCDRCRGRLSAIASRADEASHACRHESAQLPAATDVLRERLQANMAELAARWDRSVWFRLRRRIESLPLVIRAGASVALLALGLRAVWPVQDMTSSISTSRSMEGDALPIRAITPGAAGPADPEALCRDHALARPPIPASLRQAVLRRYGMEHVPEREYELDYLITPELGGIADARNLWPERYGTPVWNATVKDDLERRLYQLVCQGTLGLTTAQREIADNWIAAYRKYFETDRPLPTQSGVADGNAASQLVALRLSGN